METELAILDIIRAIKQLKQTDFESLMFQLEQVRINRSCTCEKKFHKLVSKEGAKIVTMEKLCNEHTPKAVARYTDKGFDLTTS